jgi:hypothetical protein
MCADYVLNEAMCLEQQLRIISKTAMRHIAGSHVLYRDQINGKLTIASCLFTSPPISGHRHIAMLYWLFVLNGLIKIISCRRHF